MDNSTDGVTLYAGFVFDLLSCYPKDKTSFAVELYKMADALDPEQPTAKVPIALYNRMCDWIEKRVGPANVRRAGMAIGERAYTQMLSVQGMSAHPSPLEILQGLKAAAATMIQDPKGRGWEIQESTEDSILMRRTQTFNCVLQEGLLSALVSKTGVRLPRIDHLRCARRGDEYCEYGVTWMV